MYIIHSRGQLVRTNNNYVTFDNIIYTLQRQLDKDSKHALNPYIHHFGNH